MDKMTMAHEYVMSRLSNPKVTWSSDNLKIIVNHSWDYADAMQAESDKRSIIGVPEVILKASNSSELDDCDHHWKELTDHKICKICNKREGFIPWVKDWQPDWSQAPDYCHFFCVVFNGGYGFFTDIYPELMDDCFYVGCGGLMIEDHGYIGNWQDSLRERP